MYVVKGVLIGVELINSSVSVVGSEIIKLIVVVVFIVLCVG